MMCIQTPGSFVWVVSLASREGTDWSSWCTYLVTGVLQGGLLGMCLMWEAKARREGRKGEPVVGAQVEGEGTVDEATQTTATERTPLLREEGRD